MPRALVTGASAGLGAEFARQLARRGYDLVLVARDQQRLAGVREDVSGPHGPDVEILAADLASDEGCAEVGRRIARGDVDLLVNNAGMGSYRPFGAADLAREEAQLDLNVRAVLRLSHAAVVAMTARGSGRIANVSSVAAFVPRGTNVTYSASKAWVTMFSEALAVQLHGSPVTVTAVCPGFTRTEFHERAGVDMGHVPQRMWLPAADVVRTALDDIEAGKALSIHGRRYQALISVARTLPPSVLRAVMARRGM